MSTHVCVFTHQTVTVFRHTHPTQNSVRADSSSWRDTRSVVTNYVRDTPYRQYIAYKAPQ